MSQSKPCMFCFAERGSNIRRSAEHLLSRPVARAFGIDRDNGEVSRFSGDRRNSTVRLNGLKRKSVCVACNNGWMNQLEQAMPNVAAWFFAGDRSLDEGLNLTLRKWLLTRHLLLCEIDGNTANFGDVDELEEDYVVPPSSLARAVYEDTVDAIAGAPIALGRSSADLDFAWAFGHPAVRPEGRPQLGRFAATSGLTMREFQAWVTTPIIFDYEIYAPPELQLCVPGLRAEDLERRPGIPRSTDLTVAFRGVEETAAAIDRLASMSESEIRAISGGSTT
ncbi:hypothetical protein [Nocardioides stalactiti]|uniref:hypothetical protein n=1 Tax=Nocardioides stalactiti TaxID=2755356 RepID=UPI001601A40F|nr:hypothetical protein [Nocardioides stalactiti]